MPVAASQKRQPAIFTTIKSEGAILPMDLLRRVSDPQTAQLKGLTPRDYHHEGERLNEAINVTWTRLLGLWHTFRGQQQRLAEYHTGVSETREWLLKLFDTLGYGRLQPHAPLVVGERSYAISHGWGDLPIHLVSYKADLDKSAFNEKGERRQSPHSLVQELLNRSPEHPWGIVSNGLTLRILRNNVSLTRQAYVEFDLEEMFEQEVYSDFVLFWLLCHESRFEKNEEAPQGWLENWSKEAHQSGVQALDHLRESVTSAIKELGSGFITHPANGQLRQNLGDGSLSALAYYNQLLRLVYRLLVLFVAEDRDILFDPDALSAAKQLYRDYYSTAHLRALADRTLGTRHSDLYFGLQLIMTRLGQDGGCPELGLPALNGKLFHEDALSDLKDCQLANYTLLAAIRHLGYMESGHVRRVIDYKNLGSEELGSVYESLLELHPVFHLDTGTFELSTAAGNARKTTGSYYTPTSLITCLLDSALDPVLDEAADKPTVAEAEAAILNLKVCDPACGSGHFLVAAAHRLAKKLAAVRTGDAEPSPAERRRALREVVGRCIYGVDINPMAVELCKVSLWMEAIDPGKPLSFLDAHIQQGNSLLGTTPALLKAGIPDEAFEAIEGDDKKVCTEFKKKNKMQREGNVSLFPTFQAQPVWVQMGTLVHQMLRLDQMPDQSVADVRKKDEFYHNLRLSGPYKDALLWANAWCAAFVWKKNRDKMHPPLTEEEFRYIGSRPFAYDKEREKIINELAEQYQFFHWHLAFPDVFHVPAEGEKAENEQAGWSGGFDVMLGNPPWESVEIDKNTSLDDKRIIAAFQSFVSHSDLYRLVKGRRNLYSLFAEITFNLVSYRGRIGVILPSGIVTDKPNEDICKYIVNNGMISELIDFENHGLFSSVHDQYRFCLLTIVAKGGITNPLYGFLFHDPFDKNVRNKTWSISAKEVELLSPTRFSVPCFSSSIDAEIAKKIYRTGITLHTLQLVFANPIDSTLLLNFDNKSKAIKRDVSENLLEGDNSYQLKTGWSKVYEGEYFHVYDHRYATYQNKNVRYATLQEKKDANWQNITLFVATTNDGAKRWQELGYNSIAWYIGLRRQSRISDETTSIAAILPQSVAEGSVSSFYGPMMDGILTALLCANFNSYVFNYIVRMRQNGPNLSKSIYEQIPLIRIIKEYLAYQDRESNIIIKSIVQHVLELTYTAYDLAPFAHDCGYDGPPFCWEEERRFLLRCELDAMYFHLYDIARDDVGYIMETFPIVKRGDEKRHHEYRTKRVILEIYDEMQRAMENSVAYQTRLMPGPADPAIAHEYRELSE
jgi:type I restriction-modification system DNA methylase subunit